jgi:hypothetical protein
MHKEQLSTRETRGVAIIIEYGVTDVLNHEVVE